MSVGLDDDGSIDKERFDSAAGKDAESNVGTPIVHLHIGMPKSGSSAIQQSLHQHRQQLAVRGLLVPSVGQREGAHYELVRELRENRPLKLWLQALAEGGNNTVRIISAEGLWFCTPDEVARLADVLQQRRVFVHVYLREPAAFLCSLYRQRIKASGRCETVSEFLAQAEASVDYPKILESWKRWFKVRAVVYEARRDQVVQDFAHAIGLDGFQWTDSKILNPTPSDGALKLMALANRCLPPGVARMARSTIQMTHPLWNWLGSIDDSMLTDRASQSRRGWAFQELVSLGISADELKAWTRL